MLTKVIKDSKTGAKYCIISINAPEERFFIQVFLQRTPEAITEVLPMEYEDKEARDDQFKLLENKHNARKFCDGVKNSLDHHYKLKQQKQQQPKEDE